jgi:hypothetical protein
VRETPEDFGEVVFRIESLRTAVGQEGVDQRVVFSGPEAAEEHPIFHAQLGGSDHVLDKVGVEFERSDFKADEELRPLVEGVGDGLADIACGEVRFAVREDEAVKFVGDGAAAGAPDEFAAGWRCRALPDLLFDEIDFLDQQKGWDGDFGGGFAQVCEFPAYVG